MYVRPILEYATVVWASHTGCDIERLEAVQRFVMSDYNRTSSVTIMLQDLNWDTLSSRRQTSRLCLLYKILHNIVDVTLPSYITPSTRFTRVTIKNSSYPNLELMHISLISFQIQLDYATIYPLKQYMHTQLTDFVIYLIPLINN